MRQDNVQFLKDRLFFLGFGDNLHTKLENKIKEGPEKFTLEMQGEFGTGDKKKIIDYSLDFSKSKKEDMYFVNNYTATLKGEKPELDKTQKFFLNNGSGVTAKEAFNLLEGRAVHKSNLVNKSGDEYSAWLQLNFKEKDKHENHKVQLYSDGWKYDLEKSVAKHPIRELASEELKGDLMKNLKKGNLHQVTFTKDGEETKMFIEANPKERNVNVYDEKMIKQFQGIRQPAESISKPAKQDLDKGQMDFSQSQLAPSSNSTEKKTADQSKTEKKGMSESPANRTGSKKRRMSV